MNSKQETIQVNPGPRRQSWSCAQIQNLMNCKGDVKLMYVWLHIQQCHMHFSVSAVCPGNKKTCLAVPSPLCTWKRVMDMYQYSLKPRVCLPFAAGVQMLITLWSADTCMTKVDSWWPCTSPITNLSITVSQGTGVGEDIHRLRNTYCTAACCSSDGSPHVITSHHAGKRSIGTLQVSVLNKHQCIMNVIMPLIQHDTNLS